MNEYFSAGSATVCTEIFSLSHFCLLINRPISTSTSKLPGHLRAKLKHVLRLGEGRPQKLHWKIPQQIWFMHKMSSKLHTHTI